MIDHHRLEDIVAEAARMAMGKWPGAGHELASWEKTPGSPVCEADIEVDQFLRRELGLLLPAAGWLSEETADNAGRLDRDLIWLVDPIDGTRDFIAGDSGFVVMIGLAIDGRPAVGAVAHPITGKVYVGAAAIGAWVEATPGDRVPIHTSLTASPPDIRLVASKSHRTARVDAVKQALQITDEINVGSIGLKIGLVSDGTRDLYFYGGGRTKIWDTCGPEAVLLGAGGRLTDVDGAPLVYDRPELYNRRGIVASNGPLHDLVITTVAPLVGTY
jgi:3'(2'),5'-bisphosphate nucleotidase